MPGTCQELFLQFRQHSRTLLVAFLADARQPWTSYRRDIKTRFDQSDRGIGIVKSRPTLRTLRAKVDVFSLENVRSPALLWMSAPGVAPLPRAYPRLMNAVPSGLSRRFATKLKRSFFLPARDQKKKPKGGRNLPGRVWRNSQRCQAQLLQFRQHFCTLLVSFWLLPVNRGLPIAGILRRISINPIVALER